MWYQSVASNQIAKNVERTAQMSEENSSAVAHISGTAREMESKAVVLEDIVKRFRINA